MKIKPILQKTYFRTFLLLTTVLICSIIPFVYLLSAEFAKYTMLEVHSNSQNEVNNLASKAEMILGNLKANGLSMYADQNIQNWFFNTSNDPLINHAALVAQSNFMSTEPLIQRSYLINLKHDLVVDSKAGIVRNESFADQRMLERVESFHPQYLRFFNHSLDGSDSLALILPATPRSRLTIISCCSLINRCCRSFCSAKRSPRSKTFGFSTSMGSFYWACPIPR